MWHAPWRLLGLTLVSELAVAWSRRRGGQSVHG